MRMYFIFSGQLSQKSAEDKLDEVLEIIKEGGKDFKKRILGLRDLAYKIKNSKGYYYMINCECNPENIRRI